MAGFLEVLAEYLHGEGDGATMGSTDEALEGVATYMEAEAGVLVTVEGAEGFVFLYLHAEGLGDLLDGDFAEFLNVECFHFFDV